MLNRKLFNVPFTRSQLCTLWLWAATRVGDVAISSLSRVWQLIIRRADLYLLTIFSLCVWCLFASSYPFFLIKFAMGQYTTDEVRLGMVMMLHDVPAFLYGYLCVGTTFFFITWRNFLTALSQNLGWVASNPLKDIDLSVNTDFEDMLAFLSDVSEFVEQDKSFLLDFMFNFSPVTALGAGSAGLLFFVLSRLPHSAALTKLFW